MNGVLFILTIASLNTALGFAIAVYLGRRYRANVPSDWDFGEDLSWADVQGETSEGAPGEAVAEEGEDDSEQTVGEDGERLDVAIDQETATTLADEAQERREAQEAADSSETTPEEVAEEPPAEMAKADTELESPEVTDTGPETPEATDTEPEVLEAAASEETPPSSEAPSEVSEETEQEEMGPSDVTQEAEAAEEEEAEAEREPTETSEAEDLGEETEEQVSEPAATDVATDEEATTPETPGLSEAEEATATAEEEGVDTEVGEEASQETAEESAEPSADVEAEASPEEEPEAEEEQPVASTTEEAAVEQAEAAEVADEEKEEMLETAPGLVEEAEPPSESEVAEFQKTLERSEASTRSDEAIEDFLSEIEQYQQQLGQADTQLRAQVEDPDSNSIRECLASLLEASRDFAQQREQARNRLDGVGGETAEFGVASVRLDGAIGQQNAQIESTERAIAAFPYIDDLEQGCRVMIGETTKLMDANLRVRDSLQEVGIQLARGENRLTNLEPDKTRDALTGTESRESLEGALLQWMHGNEEEIVTLSIAVLDVDAFSQVNEQYGHGVGNELLHAFGKLLVAENGNRARLARISGERFALLFPNVDLRAAANAVERLRQIVELSRFDYKKSEIQITISCGVAESTGDDTSETVMARAEATLMEAKRYGRNRTFIHEGKYPTPVVPPKFNLEPRRMTL